VLRIRHFVSSLMLVGLSTLPSQGADRPATTILKEKGLTRSGRLFVIEAEDSVLEKWRSTRAMLAEYTATAGRRSQAEQAARESAQFEERRVELQQRLNELNQAINEQGFQQLGNNRPAGFGPGGALPQLIAQRDMVRMNLAEVVSTQKSIKADGGPDQKGLEEEGKKSQEAAKAALAEFRKSVDAVVKRYGELGADASVKSALRALEKDGQGTFKLGPTPAFKAAVKALENAERTILAKPTAGAPRKKVRSRR
jgi:hypothetical protein